MSEVVKVTEITNRSMVGVEFPGERAKVVKNPRGSGFIGIAKGVDVSKAWVASTKLEYIKRAMENNSVNKGKLFKTRKAMEDWWNGK